MICEIFQLAIFDEFLAFLISQLDAVLAQELDGSCI
jgi:hypothetical protein